MMKKLSFILAIIMLTSVIGGCASKKIDIDAQTSTDKVSAETKTEEESGGIEVDKNLLSVEITLPPSIAGDQSDFNKETYLKENDGFLDAEVTADGSLKIKMTKKKHQEMVSEVKNDMQATFVAFIGGEDTPYIKDFTSENDYKEIAISVDGNAYENAVDFTPLLVGFSVAMYQAVKGEAFDCNIKIVDHATKELISDINYPEDFEG